ncbi:MAG: hypothetical protein ACQKBY_00470, partial [Verrucomicrobiales bacterium]
MGILTAVGSGAEIRFDGQGEVKSLEEAVLAARKLEKPARVRVAAGVYRVEKPLVLGPEDSQVEWVAEEGAEVVISGGREIRGWVKGEGNVWSA